MKENNEVKRIFFGKQENGKDDTHPTFELKDGRIKKPCTYDMYGRRVTHYLTKEEELEFDNKLGINDKPKKWWDVF